LACYERGAKSKKELKAISTQIDYVLVFRELSGQTDRLGHEGIDPDFSHSTQGNDLISFAVS